MSGLLRWKGDALRLGKTQMGLVRQRSDGLGHEYELGPGDFVSRPLVTRDEAAAACERHVRRLLAGAGVSDP